MKNFKLTGTGVALVTPFHSSGNIDFSSLSELVEYVIRGGVDFVVVLGTTAEAATMNADEKRAVVETVYEVVDGRVGVVVGAGGNNTRQVVNLLSDIDCSKTDAILSVSPYYNKPNQKGIYAHFKEIAMATDLPVIVYNVPGRTSSNITAETVLRLAADFDNIKAVKEASGNMIQIMNIIKNKPEDFTVLSGDDALTLPILAAGGDGVISVVANAYPKTFSDMVSQMVNGGDRYAALRNHYQLLDVISALFEDGNPAGIKALLEIKGILKNNLRLPLVKANRQVYNKLKMLDETMNLS
jgi:4-hydroxy-tetrahydrodipicolinate synthase